MLVNSQKILLPVKRFRQFPNECAIAAVSSLANFYDSNIEYHIARRLLPSKVRKNGTYTPQHASILNDLGFQNVSIISGDLDFFDFSWRRLSKKSIINKLTLVKQRYKRNNETDNSLVAQSYIDWLSNEEYNNRIVIDCDLVKHIKRSLNSGRPVVASFNWTRLFKYTKELTRHNSRKDICGEAQDHAIVIRGYDNAGIFVVDSLASGHSKKHEKYKCGYYKLKWELFLVNATNCELILLS